MRLIDADALEEGKFHSIEDWTPVEKASWQWGWNDAIDAIISNAPTVDPIKHGHWIEIDTQYVDETKCSVCGVIEYFNKEWKRFNYCPNCGAKMDEVEEHLTMPKADGSTIPKSYMEGVTDE